MDDSNIAGNQRQKRVLPSRSRRGGPGIGSCDIDLMILDTQKRKAESDPLIPVDTPFLLTTNSSLVPPISPTASFPDESKNQNTRYFDRADVLESFKEQQIIQTPEFSLLSEQASVSSRFRPRSSEDEIADTSDAAYEKRHRKYETFEKRQRLREKEKLKHEQYKLKERIEQLRVMDGAAFLALPSSSFSPPPGRTTDEAVDDASLLGAHANGTVEGERRRKEMLDVALALVERYRTLLPRERKGLEKDKKIGGMGNYSESEFEMVGRDTPTRHDEDTETDGPVAETGQEREKIKLKIPARLSRSSPETKWRTSQSPNIPKTSRSKAQTPLAYPLSLKSPTLTKLDSEPSTSRPTTPRPIRNTADVHANGFLPQLITGRMESIPHVRTRKRKKYSTIPSLAPEEFGSHEEWDSSSPNHWSALSPLASYAGVGGQTEYTTSLLLISAYRNFSAPKARKTQRHVTAFGYKVPAEIEHWKDFELPAWLVAKDDVDAEGLEVEGQLLAGVDMDSGGGLVETSIVEIKDINVASERPFAQQKLDSGSSETMNGQDDSSAKEIP